MFQSSVQSEEIENMTLAAFEGEIHVIDEAGEELEYAIDYLKRQKIIGFDTESRPSFTPSQPHYGVSLLQLSGENEAFLFRIKLMGLDKRLCDIMADPEIIKVGAAVHDDVRGLQKYCEFNPSGFVDLQKIVWEYGIKDKSVKKMSAIILGIRISKTQQLSNWEADYLSDSQLKYAATDAWVCREMYFKLMDSEKNPLSDEERFPHPVANAEQTVATDIVPADKPKDKDKDKTKPKDKDKDKTKPKPKTRTRKKYGNRSSVTKPHKVQNRRRRRKTVKNKVNKTVSNAESNIKKG